MRLLEIGDKINRIRRGDGSLTIEREYVIDRVTKLFAFCGDIKFKREPEYENFYSRVDANYIDAHYLTHILNEE